MALQVTTRDCAALTDGDLDEMASRIAMLLASEEMRQRLGEQAQSRVRTLHDVGIAAPQILDVIERTVAWHDRSR